MDKVIDIEGVRSQEFRSSGVQEFRSSGVQEFRSLEEERRNENHLECEQSVKNNSQNTTPDFIKKLGVLFL